MLEKLLNRTVAYKQFTYKPNGLLTVRLLPKQQEELNKRLKELESKLYREEQDAINKHKRLVAEAKAKLQLAIEQHTAELNRELSAAQAEFAERERNLLIQFSTPLSDSEVALMTTKIGDFVPPVKKEATT